MVKSNVSYTVHPSPLIDVPEYIPLDVYTPLSTDHVYVSQAVIVVVLDKGSGCDIVTFVATSSHNAFEITIE